ncbi:MAG: diacylglycerol kinase family lipid kinase [Sphaerobacteraceae bacterium]|nr:MAG: diacylglycerol kinase family lipid kinase [Sphaerobacteraceae bacterium]
MSERTRAIAIMNPNTGRLPSDKVAWFLGKMLEQTYDVEFRFSTFAGEERDLAEIAADEADLVIAVGGDGTVAHVAAGIMGKNVDMAILPNGSTNVVARGLGIPGDPFRAARALQREMEPRWIDVGVSGDRIILHMAGSGLDSLMFRDTRPELKRFFAWLAYVPPALKHLRTRPWKFKLTIDGETLETEARMVLVANGSFVVNPRFKVGKDIKIDDGYLDLLVFRPPNIAASLSLAGWIALGRPHRSRHVYQTKAKSFSVDSNPPAPVEFDGDYVGVTPFEVTVSPRALHIMTPVDRPGTRKWNGPTYSDMGSLSNTQRGHY